jgi:hypothetical protein
MGANPLSASECSRKNLDLMVQSKSIRRGLLLRAIIRKKEKISLTLTHPLPD